MEGAMGGVNSLGYTLLLLSAALVVIGAGWLAIGIRKWKRASRRRQEAWTNLLSELPLEEKTMVAKGLHKDTKAEEED